VLLFAVFYIPFCVTSRFQKSPSDFRITFLNAGPPCVVYLWALLTFRATWLASGWHGVVYLAELIGVALLATICLAMVFTIGLLHRFLPPSLRTENGCGLGVTVAVGTAYIDLLLKLLLTDAVRVWAAG